MKKFVLLAMMFVMPVLFAQTVPKPTESAPTLSEHQTDKIQLAIKDWQIAQMQSTQAQNVTNTAQQVVLAAVEKAKKELGLDDTWDFNYQTLTFFKKPEPTPPVKK